MKKKFFSLVLVLVFLEVPIFSKSYFQDIFPFFAQKLNKIFLAYYENSLISVGEKEKNGLLKLKKEALASFSSFHQHLWNWIEENKGKKSFSTYSLFIGYLIFNYDKYNFYYKNLYLNQLVKLVNSAPKKWDLSLLLSYLCLEEGQKESSRVILNRLSFYNLSEWQKFYLYHFFYLIDGKRSWIDKIISLKCELKKYYLLYSYILWKNQRYWTMLKDYHFGPYFKAIFLGEKIFKLHQLTYQELDEIHQVLPQLPLWFQKKLFEFLQNNRSLFLKSYFGNRVFSSPEWNLLFRVKDLLLKPSLTKGKLNRYKVEFRKIGKRKNCNQALYQIIAYYLGELSFKNMFFQDAYQFYLICQKGEYGNVAKKKISFLKKILKK